MKRWAVGLTVLVATLCWLGVIQAQAAKKGAKANTEKVKEAQTLMKDLGLYPREATGQHDDATKEAIKKFQKERKLKATGNPNQATLKALREAKGAGKKGEAAPATTSTSTGGAEEKK